MFWKRAKRVQCKNCGFLTFDRELTSLTPEETWGNEVPSEFRIGLLGLLACFNDVCEFDGTVVNEDRECSEFFPWQKGCRPREHISMKVDRKRHSRNVRVAIVGIFAASIIGIAGLILQYAVG